MEEVLRVTGDREACFWNTQGGAELDLLVCVNGQRLGSEFKYADAPTVSKSLNIARDGEWHCNVRNLISPILKR